MKYEPETIKAAAVVIAALGALPGAAVEIPADLAAAALEQPLIAPAGPRGPKPTDLMDLWNSKKDDRLPRCCAMTAKRRKHCTARLREFPRKEDWGNFLAAINTNPWALGENPSPAYPNWRADFDWFIRPGSIVRHLEGRFSAAPAAPKNTREVYTDDLDRR